MKQDKNISSFQKAETNWKLIWKQHYKRNMKKAIHKRLNGVCATESLFVVKLLP